MSRSRGHLRLVEPLPEEEAEPTSGYTVPTGHPSTWHWAVDTGTGALEFKCPACGKVQRTDRPVLQRWCTGNSVTTGIRTHAPTEMVRTELSD